MLADSLCFIWIDFILPEKLSWLWKYGCKNANFETSQSNPPPLSLLPPFHTHANTHTTSKTSQWRLRSKIDLRVAPNDDINAIIKKFENHPSIQKIKENGNWYHIFPFFGNLDVLKEIDVLDCSTSQEENDIHKNVNILKSVEIKRVFKF